MKILIGVCGIGKGHCIRQYELSRELIKNGHEVRIFTYGEGINFFSNSKMKVYDVYVPMITFKGDKINVYDCIKRNWLKIIPGKIHNNNIYRELLRENFLPDLCISDHEPTVAKIAYKLNKPLINIDQHSKFIYMNDTINGYSNIEEKRRLQFFFPKSDKKFVVSFYDLPKGMLPNNIELLYPIIRNDLKEISKQVNSKKKQILVYFSKYIDIPIKQSMEEIIKIFNSFKNYNFIIFSTEYAKSGEKIKENVTILKNQRERFVKELINSCAVISTAGHTLISEALYCNIPLFVIPLPTYDQNYCGKFINDNQIGYSSDLITIKNLSKFLNNIEMYRNNIKKCENLVKEMNTLKYLVSKIEEYEK